MPTGIPQTLRTEQQYHDELSRWGYGLLSRENFSDSGHSLAEEFDSLPMNKDRPPVTYCIYGLADPKHDYHFARGLHGVQMCIRMNWKKWCKRRGLDPTDYRHQPVPMCYENAPPEEGKPF